MSVPNDQEAEFPLLGIDFVFEMGMKKIEEQLKEIEALDVKLGILFGFLGTVLVALLAVVFTAEQSAGKALVGWPGQVSFLCGTTSTGLAIVIAFFAFRKGRSSASPPYQAILPWVHGDPKHTKFAFVNTLLTAVEANDQSLKDKQGYTKWATWFAFLGFLSFLFAIIVMSSRLLFQR